MELEEGKQTTSEQLALQTILENVRTVDEAKFLLEKMCGASISQVCDVELSQSRLKEKEVLLNTVQQDSNMHQELLQHVLARNPTLGITEINLSNPQHSSSSLTAMANLLSNTLAVNNSMSGGGGDNNNLIVNRSSTSSSRSPSPSTVDQ
jgi:kinesin family member 21